jgi:uncharacterized protein
MTMISTRSGRNVSLLNPSAGQIEIGDIAHGLAQQCRFNGQTSKFYSVAQHSVLVSSILPKELKLAGLLHDAAEAYLGDIVQPLKILLPEFNEIESRFMQVISERFDVKGLDHPEIKHADLIALATERRDLMPMEQMDWPVLTGISALRIAIHPMSPDKAAKAFLDCFFRLQQGHRNMVNMHRNRDLLSSLIPRQWLATQ